MRRSRIGRTATDPPELADLTRRPAPGSHRITTSTAAGQTETLADLPPLRDRLLFVGPRPHPVSVAAGHYHQDPQGRLLWARLVAAQILSPGTPTATADDTLAARGHGLTDLLKRPGPWDEASDAELMAGVGPLWQKAAIWRPAAVVFIESRSAGAAAGRAVHEPWGRLADVALAGRPCLLLPGLDRPATEVEAGLAFFRDLAGIIEGLLPADGADPEA